jgi:hypothetical protein
MACGWRSRSSRRARCALRIRRLGDRRQPERNHKSLQVWLSIGDDAGLTSVKAYFGGYLHALGKIGDDGSGTS